MYWGFSLIGMGRSGTRQDGGGDIRGSGRGIEEGKREIEGDRSGMKRSPLHTEKLWEHVRLKDMKWIAPKIC